MSEPSSSDASQEKAPRRALILPIAFFALIIAVFLIGKFTGLIDTDALQGQFEALAASPWALPVIIITFCACAFIGVPQFALIAIVVAAFGPVFGAAYSWVASMISGALTFWVGRLAGEKTLRKYAGNSINRLSKFVGRNAFVASAMVRLIPTGPFLTTNMAFGVSHAKFLHYFAGMGIGILPKILIIAFAGGSIMSAFKGNPVLAVLGAVAAIALYIGVAAFARSRMTKKGQDMPSGEADSVDSAADSNE